MNIFFLSWTPFFENTFTKTTFKWYEKKSNLFFYSCLFWNTNWIFSSFHELTFSKIILQTQHFNEYKQNIQSFSILHVFSELLTKHLNIFFLSWTAFFKNNDEISIANTTFRFFLTFMSLLLEFESKIQQLNFWFIINLSCNWSIFFCLVF